MYQRQTAVTAYFTSKQLLLFAFVMYQRQTAVTAYFTSKQLLLFAFVMYQRQTAVTAYFTSQQLLLFVFTIQNRPLITLLGGHHSISRVGVGGLDFLSWTNYLFQPGSTAR